MTETAAKIELPPYKPLTPQELLRRQKLGEEIRRLREEMGPIGRSMTELIREGREDR
jgi:hypothetical protein